MRVLPFDIVAIRRGGVGLGFGLCRLLGRTQPPGAKVAAVFNVVGFGEWRNHSGTAGDLADAAQNDFGAGIIEFDGAMNFDRVAGETAHITDILQIRREDHNCEGASYLILTEVEEVNAFRANFDVQHFPGDTLGLADVLVGLVNWDAVTSGEQPGRGEWTQGRRLENGSCLRY